MNTFGRIFRWTLLGESHGNLVGVLVDGVPAGLKIDQDSIQRELDRRRPAQSPLTTQRRESDRVEILTGVFEGRTTGAPILMVVRNEDVESSPYEKMRHLPRPGHADFPVHVKYRGFHDPRGAGMFSGRLTAGSVMAGALASKILDPLGIEVAAHASVVGGVRGRDTFSVGEIRSAVEKNPVRTADLEAAPLMVEAIERARKERDSVGGIVSVVAEGVPAGLGDPLADGVESLLSHALFGIPAVKGVEFGDGFEFAFRRGSEVQDPYIRDSSGRIRTRSNHNGGILGGITTGSPLRIRVVFKPTSSIPRPQETVDLSTGEETTLVVRGRHDPCIVPRAVPVVEGVVRSVLADLVLLEGLHGRA